MSSQIEVPSGQQRMLEQFTTTGSQPDGHHQIRTAVVEQISADSSMKTIRDHVLKTLCRHVPGIGLADVHELRVSLSVDVNANAPVDEQVTAVLQAAVATLAEWDHL